MGSMTAYAGKVMFIISSLRRAGAQTQLVYLAAGLAQRGWQVTVVYYRGMADSVFLSQLDLSGVVRVELSSPFGIHLKSLHRVPHNLGRLLSIVRKNRPDVIVGFMYPGMMAARIIGRVARVPVVISSVQSEREFPKRETLLRVTGFLTDAVTIMSRKIAEDLALRNIASEQHLHVVPNMVDTLRFSPGSTSCREFARRRLGISDSDFLWLAVSRLAPAKDIPNMLYAFSEYSYQRTAARLLIAGGGPKEQEVAELIVKLNLESSVRLLGTCRNTPYLYRACDAFVLSSAWEGVPTTVLEAMACEIPIVATRVGGVHEIVTDGETGFLVERENHEALASAMDRMMALPMFARKRLGQAGRERVHPEFSIDSIIVKWEALITSLLKRKNVSRYR